MRLVRISSMTPLDGFYLRLTLTDGSVIKRDVEPLLVGPVFETVRDNPDVFRAAKVAAGTVVWPNGADLYPDVLIWGGPPRKGAVPAKRNNCYVPRSNSWRISDDDGSDCR